MTDDTRVLRGDDLLRAAKKAGFRTMTDRRLEDFRRDGLMPRPVRVANDGRRPVWIYPTGSDRQLVRLLCWRQHTKRADVLRVVLWLEGFPLALDAVRTSASAVLDGLLHELDQALHAEASRQGLDPVAEQDTALYGVATTLAAQRGTNAVPRPIRVPAGERATAIAHLLQIFALGKQPDVTEEQARTIEKVLGVSPGRRQRVEDAGPWLTGPASALVGAADIVSLPRMAEALAEATDAQWQEARSPAAALFLQLPLATRALAAMTGKENVAGMGGLPAGDSEPLTGVLLIAFVLAARRADWAGNVQSLTDALTPWPALISDMQQVLDMPQHQLAHNLAGHGPETRDRTQRIINALQDGQLDSGPHPPPDGR
ncbi:hypothetical protein [Streptomyces sp. NPDC003635]